LSRKKSIVLPPEFFVVIQKIEAMNYAMSFLLGHTGDGINRIAGSTDDYDFMKLNKKNQLQTRLDFAIWMLIVASSDRFHILRFG
jgi:hypothetical protein